MAIVITGGAAGIGRATALACARRGDAVAVLDLDPDTVEQVRTELVEAGARAAIGVVCDVRSEQSVAAAIDAATRALGPLEGLVTSAGIDRGGLVHELSLERWETVIATNLTGTFLACKHALKHMIIGQRAGAIVCVSSPWAEVSAPGGASAYCASKGGVSALVRSLALDYAEHGIRVNGIYPGATETALMWAGVEGGTVSSMRALVSSQLALKRLGTPEEIAHGILWLLGKEAGYVTGSHLTVDGGLMARGSIAC